MKVAELIERLQKERPEEEVVFVFDDNRFEYYRPEWQTIFTRWS